MSASRVIRGGIWLYVRSLVNNATGYIYWFLISSIAGAKILGFSSATVTLATLVSGTIDLGVPVALQRFLGASLGRNKRKELGEYFWSALSFSLVSKLMVGLFLIIAGLSEIQLFRLNPEMLKYAGALVCLGWISTLDSLLISYLKTKVSAISYSLGSFFKLGIGLPLVWMGWGWQGVIMGYLASYAVTGISLASFSKGLGIPWPKPSLNALRDLFTAGLSVWTPGVIALVGQKLGTLAVFGAKGGVETGRYYAAFSIAGVVWAFPLLVLSLLVPVLSGMEDGRKRATWRMLKISTALSATLSALLLAYPSLLLALLGKEYVEASETLMVLALSAVPTTIVAGVNSLAFSYGRYGLILGIGVAQSVPRLLLYFLLAPPLGGLGVAAAFTSGSLFGFTATVLACRSLNLRLGWRELGEAFLAPFSLAVALYYARIPWPIGIPLLAILTTLFYVKAAVLTRSDLRDLALALVPMDRVPALASMLRWLDQLLYGGEGA